MKFVDSSSRTVLAIAFLVLLAQATVAQGDQPSAEVRGHASFGSGGSGGPGAPDQISFDAWLDQAGIAHGTVAWTSASHGLPWSANARYPWQLAVTGLFVSGQQAVIQAVVTASPQASQDVGLPALFTVIDNGNGGAVPDQIEANFNPLASINGGSLKVKSQGGNGPPACAVRGHGIWDQVVGVTAGGQQTNQISINAWLDASGDPHGMVVWNSVTHQVPGNPGNPVFSPGPGGSAHPWYINVTGLGITGNVANVIGVVVHSPQVPEEEGTPVSFVVEDLGSGGSSGIDRLSSQDILGGNFTVTPCPMGGVPWFVDNDVDYYTAFVGYFPSQPFPGATESIGAGFDCYDNDDQRITCNEGDSWTYWFADNDGDGYTVYLGFLSESPCPSCQIVGTPGLGFDCNDSNPSITVCF